MFNFFSDKRKLSLYAPVKGRLMDVAEAPDEVFRSGMMGDGIAVDPVEGIVTAPCDGETVVVPSTGHAVALRSDNGVEVLIHIGLDTVELNGQGFTVLVRPGDKVKKGQRLIKFDLAYIKSQNKPLISPMVITNMADKVAQLVKRLDRPEGPVIEITLK